MFAQKAQQTLSFTASSPSVLQFDDLPQKIDGYWAHVHGILLRLVLNVTPNAGGSDIPGRELYKAITELRIKDRMGVEIYRLKGWMLKTALQAMTGKIIADPATIPFGGGAVSRTLYIYLPCHGGDGGILGGSEMTDFIQPTDRLRRGYLEIDWAATAVFGASTSINSGTLTTQVITWQSNEVIQGADFRVSYTTGPAGQSVDFPFTGIAQLMACISNPDYDHSDYTLVSCPANHMLTSVEPALRVAEFNRVAVGDRADEVSTTAPEVLPLVFMGRSSKMSQAVRMPGGRVRFDLTTSHATDQYLAYCELHSRESLVQQLAQKGSDTLYMQVRSEKPKYAAKNRSASMNATKRGLLDLVLPAKLM